MACPGRALVSLLLTLVVLPACRYNRTRVDDGAVVADRDLERIEVDVATRAHVLESLGPPDTVRYTPAEEILIYEFTRHRGSDLSLVVPVGLFAAASPVGIARSVGDALSPGFRDVPAIRRPRILRVVERIIGLLVPLAPGFVGNSDVLEIQGRSKMQEVVRVVLDRRRGVVTGTSRRRIPAR